MRSRLPGQHDEEKLFENRKYENPFFRGSTMCEPDQSSRYFSWVAKEIPAEDLKKADSSGTEVNELQDVTTDLEVGRPRIKRSPCSLLGTPSRTHLQTTEVEQCLVTREMVSITRNVRWETFNLRQHDMVSQGAEYVVADAIRLIDIVGGDLQTAEEVEAEKFIEQIDSQ